VGLGQGDAMKMSLPFGVFDQALSMLDGPRLLTGSGAPTGRPEQLYRLLRWLETLARHDGAPLPMERASTLLAYGDMLRRTGGPARARSMPA
jgi:hypothetical protein